MSTSRREFLKLAASVGAAAAGSARLRAESEPPPGRVRAWQTTKDKKFEPLESPPQWEPWRSASPVAMHLDPGARFQEVLGFGGAFTDASCYLFHQMDTAARRSLLEELFGADGLRMSVARTCIGSSDYSTKVYSFDESPEPDPQLRYFSIDHDRQWILPTLREAREVNRNLFLFSSPWSPGMDEGEPFHAGRLDAQSLFCALRPILHPVPQGVRRRGSRNPGCDRAERSGHGPGRTHAGGALGAGI